MNKQKKVFLLVILLIYPAVPYANTIHVPGDSATIQAGINGAVDGDTVLVSPGIYTEKISFSGKAIVVKSIGGTDVTYIQPSTSGGAVVTFDYEGYAIGILDGFTINGLFMSMGIDCNNSAPVIQNCDIRNCTSWGIKCSKPIATIRYNIIHDNNKGLSDGGIGVAGIGIVEISYNEIYNNSPDGGSGIKCYDGAMNIYIYRNLIRGNTSSDGLSSGISLDGSHCSIINNTIVGNSKGISIQNGSGTDIFNNIVVSNPYGGVEPDFANVDFNNAWNNGSGNYPGPNGISIDPEFISPGYNYNLLPFSPCIDAGDPDSTHNDPDGSRNDMGAFPYSPVDMPFPIDINLGSDPQLNVISHTPTIYWTFYDTTSGQAAYEIELGTDDDWGVAEMWATGEVYSTETFAVYSGSALEDGITYYFRIRVSNGSAWGAWFHNVIRMNSLPSAPNPVYPVMQDTVSINGFQLVTERSNDLEYDPLTYDFEIYSDPALTILVANRYDIPGENNLIYSGHFEGLEEDTEYWWRVRSHDGFEYSNWSTEESFFAAYNVPIHIPADHPTIQAGINFAGKGDTVLVADGIYTGEGNRDIDFGGKGIVLKSENGADVTVIECEGSYPDFHRGFFFHSGEDSTAVVDGFTIQGGYGNEGGGIKCDSSSSPKIINNTITGNSAGYGGGIYCLNSNPIISNNTISGNGAAWGGGISCDYNSNPTISNNTISGNSAFGGWGSGMGGGIFCYDYSNPTISNNTISGNSSHGGGGIYCYNYSNPAISNNVIIGNSAGHGGGISCVSSNPIISNNTISGNSAYSGGGLYLSHSSPSLENTIIAFSTQGVAVCWYYGTNNPTLTCCNIYGNEGGDWVEGIADQAEVNGNFSADPLFCDTANGDYHIYNNSPCAPANNDCGELIGALDVGCYFEFVQVYFDIKPGSCPNPINIKLKENGKAVIPAAILGTEDFDVHYIDVASLTLLGVSPIRYNYDDVSAPAEIDDSCDCSDDDPDGYEDLTLKFNRQALVTALMQQPPTETMKLTISGQLNDSTLIEGYDCVVIRPKRDGAIVDLDGNGESIIVISGDVSGDSQVNLVDVAFMIEFLYRDGKNAAFTTAAADVNATGTVNILDITYLIAYLYKEGPEPNCL